MSDVLPVPFGGLLRSLRTAAGLTQEELAEAARVSYRSISDLERGVSRFPRRDTARLLADALGLSGDDRAGFEAAARGRPAEARNTVPRPLPGGIAAAARTLPRDIALFTGRESEIESVLRAVTGSGGVADVCAIGGMAGVGKTALAVHVAHRLADGFPDGQVFLQLHGHTPGRQPVDPADALASLLQACGIPAQSIPDGLEPRAWLWRDRLAGRRMLLVLDNAAGTGQVAPLLPGDGGCLVLVTSRRHLGDLPGTVTPVLLDVLTSAQSVEMFTRLAPRAAGSPGEVAEVVRLAGFLPLAISLLARLFARHRSWTLADLAAETRAGLLTLTAEQESVAAAFELSYRHLDPARQRMFCLLSLHPGATTDGYAAAALAGTSLNDAAGLLDTLHGEGLLAETGHRRYGMHDLLRRYARDHAADLPDSEQAVKRLLDYYQHTAARADALITIQTQPGLPLAAPAGPLAAPDLDDGDQALAWARAERASLLACLDDVTRTGQHARVIGLTAGIAGLLRRDGPFAEAVGRHATAVQSARHLGDRLGQAYALANLGNVRRLTGDYTGAAGDLERALAIYRDLEDRFGQANALNDLGTVRLHTGDCSGAARDMEQALAIYRDIGSPSGQASALTYLGAVRRLTGDYTGAAGDLERALVIYRDFEDRLGRANALTYLGDARRLACDFQGAAEDLEQALVIYCDIGDRRGQANALTYLGNVRRETRDYRGAAGDLERALAIYRDIGSPSGQASALTYLGNVRRETCDFQGAAEDLEQALVIYRDIGDRLGQAEVLNETGILYRVTGEPAGAEAYHQQALELARAIGSPWYEAHALADLGRCAIATGHATRADALLRQAHEIFHRIGTAEAPSVRAEFAALTSQDPQGKP
jgi:tetratricopeptide (TPR) repeat protein/transcriptional regulator with XRE-family HTH domain